MGFRIGTFSTFRRVLLGLRQNQLANVRAQEQLSSGKRILRPSDDPTGAARAIRLERQLSDVDRYRRAITQGLSTVDSGAASLTSASNLMIQARELLIQGMNGTLTPDDRESLADQFDLIRGQLLELGNDRAGDLFLFGGTATGDKPFVEVDDGGIRRIRYIGNGDGQTIRAGASIDVDITISGERAFGRFEPSATLYGGLSGVKRGTTADEGRGYATLRFRHDSTDPGNLGAVGIALTNGGLSDTLLGANDLVIDGANGTVRLGTGPVVEIPAPPPTDLVVENELGGKLHLDLSGYAGADYAGVVTGNGSVSLDGTTYAALTFAETDLEVSDEESGRVIHLDTTGVRRAGDELVEFAGTTNAFDLMQQIATDLRNGDGLSSDKVQSRLNSRLEDLDRHHKNILVGAGTLGARSQRLSISDSRAADVEVGLQGLLSNIADADLAEVAFDLARSDYLLQLAQASGARLLQTSLLNYLG